ncbi:MAG: PDZ domain-containing protein [Steroidobacteraceae bacterium]
MRKNTGAPRLPPAERHRRQDRRRGPGQGRDRGARGRGLPGAAADAADRDDRGARRRRWRGGSERLRRCAEGRPDGGLRGRVSFGLVPDHAFQGPGVRAESVVPNSPAARAGFEAGDVLLEVDGQAVNDLGAFSAALKHYKPGDKVKAKRRHGDADSVVTVDLSER